MSKKSGNIRGTVFNDSWVINNGREVTARDAKTGSICSAKCRFCEIKRNPDENDDGDRKRKRTERTKYCTSGSYRKDSIVRHLK